MKNGLIIESKIFNIQFLSKHHTENYENTDEKQHNARYNDTGYGGERKF